MLYIERSRIITEEIRSGVKLGLGEETGQSLSGTVTRMAGSYFSRVLDRQLFLALKTPPNLYNFGDKWITDMRNHAAVYDNIPALQPELPVFLSLLKDSRGRDIGHLTEDFSEEGRYKVVEMGVWDVDEIADVKQQIVELFRDGDNQLDDEEVVNMFFWVRKEGSERRRIGDLDKAMMKLGAKIRRERFPLGHIVESQDLHTLSLD
jgi:hypothetical protein